MEDGRLDVVGIGNAIVDVIAQTEVAVCAARAGVRILDREVLDAAERLLVAADTLLGRLPPAPYISSRSFRLARGERLALVVTECQHACLAFADAAQRMAERRSNNAYEQKRADGGEDGAG